MTELMDSSSPIAQLVGLWRDPARAPSVEPGTWHQVLRAGRAMSLLARLAARFHDAGVIDALAPQVQRHLQAALAVAHQHERIIRWEVNRLRRATWQLDVPVVLLKGAAYVMAELPPGRGRLVSDVDVLVPGDRIAQVERALLDAGFVHTIDDVYDQRYYRRWMHEIPPLQHRRRGTSVDVHHTILPTTGRITVDAGLLWDQVQSIEGRVSEGVIGVGPDCGDAPGANARGRAKGIFGGISGGISGGVSGGISGGTAAGTSEGISGGVSGGSSGGGVLTLGAADMVLHSAVHLFQDGQVAGQLRDLMDLHELIETFVQRDSEFAGKLADRARQLGLVTPLRYVQRYVPRVLGVDSSLSDTVIGGAGGAGRWLVMDRLVPRALLCDVGSPATPRQRLACSALYLRSHWLRMPPLMLARHLATKALRRQKQPKASTEGDPQPRIDR